MKWIIISLICILFLLVLYSCYKLVWYVIVLIRLRIVINRKNVEFITPFYSTIFGRKGKTNFIVHSSKGDFAVSVISYITNHSRLNIEKKQKNYLIDVRRKKFIFSEFYYKSGEPDLSILHRSETSLIKSEMVLEDPGPNMSSVLLFYPKPKDLTYAEREMNYLYSGDKIGNHIVMFLDDIQAFIKE